ncbi:hypothetical protein LEMA_P068800.1 [Plenodomus lingam JN3]|uniref:RING-type domain-containing protein n=1 Tax=Leptosphaeria maculans (strain JN3 / isolate v23.1.3 / race Av1-4-5-6-7-8) TaxID=985895 RepID=E4ZJT7_LEPMJ|nr:hypothetical protein LEMA_P068800.1 [Plenodomus lingam JN3]CBX91372.1 hypothetical protein LEMA_P068800.1 [Plenodomus lingam JN3]
MPAIWIPESTLELPNDNRCHGYAHTKGRRCLVYVGFESSWRYAAILDELSQQQPDARQLEPLLRRLAHCTLCENWHKYQADRIVRNWAMKIRTAYPAGSVAVQSSPSSTPTRSILQATTVTSANNSRPLSSAQSEVEALHMTIRAMQELLRTTEVRLSMLQVTQSSIGGNSVLSPASSSDNTSRRSSIASSVSPASPTMARSPAPISVHTDSISTARMGQLLPVVAGLITSPSAETVVSTALSSGPDILLSATAESAPPQPCTRPHVHRRPIEEECPICYDSALLSTCEPSELVWCRSGCGQSIHKSCFEAWRTQCETNGRDLTCSTCRANWGRECGCTGCTAVHVRRCVVAESIIAAGEDAEDTAESMRTARACGNRHIEISFL